MRRFAAVALREIVERRSVLVAAAVASVIPLLMSLLPSVTSDQAIAARSMGALSLAFTFGIGGSLLVGASVVGRELAEKRLSFHFARPLSAPVVWGGKLVGGLALVLLAEAIVVLPTSVVIGGLPSFGDSVTDPEMVRGLLLVPVPLFLLAWVCSVALRSRSPWLIFDLTFLVALPALLFVLLRRFVRYGLSASERDLYFVLGFVLVALLAATLAQVVGGRTDPRRSHGAQSLTLWGLALAATTVGAIAGERAIDPGVSRLVEAWVEPAGESGTWISIQGSIRPDGPRGSTYLADLTTGRTILQASSTRQIVSADGSRAAWVSVDHFRRTKPEIAIETLDLRAGDTTSMDVSEWPDSMALSPDGRQLAFVTRGLCTVLELPSLRNLASARVASDPRWIYGARFLSPQKVRLYPVVLSHRRSGAGSPREVPDPEVAELDLSTKSIRTLARFPISAIPFRSVKPQQGLPLEPHFRFVPSPDQSRMLVIAYGAARSVRLLEATTGRVLAAMDGPEGGGSAAAAFVADGRAVAADWIEGRRRLVVLSPEGKRLTEIPLPEGRPRVRFGYEPAPGLLAVGTSRETPVDDWAWSLVEIDTGRLRPLGILPLHQAWWFDAQVIPPPGSPASRLAREKGTGRLVLFDPATGETKPLTRGRPAGK